MVTPRTSPTGTARADGETVIVVIEDDPNIADLLDMYLRRDGYRVFLCGDGETGLATIRDRSPRLVILGWWLLMVFYLAVGSPLDQIGERFLFSAHMLQHQLLVYPAANQPPFAAGEAPPAGWYGFQALSSPTGLPSLSLPMGLTARGGLPVGLILLARPGAEALLIQAAFALEQRQAPRVPPP